MKELHIITEKGELNYSYNIEHAALDGSDLYITVKENESDEFLSNFIKGNSAYTIFLITDEIELHVRHRVFTRSYLVQGTGDDTLIAFIIDLSFKS